MIKIPLAENTGTNSSSLQEKLSSSLLYIVKMTGERRCIKSIYLGLNFMKLAVICHSSSSARTQICGYRESKHFSPVDGALCCPSKVQYDGKGYSCEEQPRSPVATEQWQDRPSCIFEAAAHAHGLCQKRWLFVY